MSPKPTVFIVDDEGAVRESLRALVGTVGLDAESHASFREFLDAYGPDRSGCLVLDVRMPGMSGIEGLETLKANAITIPVIVITGYGDVPTAVRAMKGGAVEFFEKPFNNQALLDSIQQCIERDAARRREQAERAAIMARLALLTPREREVLDFVVAGEPNRAIARKLEIARRTVEAHRARVMNKMQAKTVQALVRMLDVARVDDKTFDE